MLGYLKSIKPKMVVLNGDIIDIWQLNESYWPKHHVKIVKHLFGCIGNSFIFFNYTNFKLSIVYLNSLNRIKITIFLNLKIEKGTSCSIMKVIMLKCLVMNEIKTIISRIPCFIILSCKISICAL